MTDERKYYVICADNCKFESMTKEQILTAIEQAINTGKIHNVDSGFITKIKEINHNTVLSLWIGKQAEYNALEEKPKDCFCIITDDTTAEDIAKALSDMQEIIDAYTAAIPPRPQITVTVSHGGTVTCTDQYGEKINPTSQDGNVWTFNVSKYGAYEIVGDYSGMKRTETVNVTAVQQYAAEIVFYDDVFANNSWEVINEMCKKKIVPSTWEVGDQKDGVTIVGKNHDIYEDGTTAPLTFRSGYTKAGVMNETATNVGGWQDCYMRNTTLAGLKIHADYVQPVKKVTSAGNQSTTLVTTYDKYFLFSEIERFGKITNSVAGEGKQYEYWASGNETESKFSSACNFWTRSPAVGNNTSFCNGNCPKSNYADPTITAGFAIATYGDGDVTYYRYTMFCF